MSCNGCRVLRKGCNENCILRQSLQGIETSQAQANATVFVAKFFGRAGLMSFLSGVPDSQRPALFQSLLFEACGRTVNPVSGAVGLLWTGNWHVCQSAVETVLRGGVLRAIPEFSGEAPAVQSGHVSGTSTDIDFFRSSGDLASSRKTNNRQDPGSAVQKPRAADLNLRLTQTFPGRLTAGGRANRRVEKRRAETPEESETTTLESGSAAEAACNHQIGDVKLLRLFF